MWHAASTSSVVMAGLDPAIDASKWLPQSVDPRVKPAGDELDVWLVQARR